MHQYPSPRQYCKGLQELKLCQQFHEVDWAVGRPERQCMRRSHRRRPFKVLAACSTTARGSKDSDQSAPSMFQYDRHFSTMSRLHLVDLGVVLLSLRSSYHFPVSFRTSGR